jgi:hypothetical protein
MRKPFRFKQSVCENGLLNQRVVCYLLDTISMPLQLNC